ETASAPPKAAKAVVRLRTVRSETVSVNPQRSETETDRLAVGTAGSNLVRDCLGQPRDWLAGRCLAASPSETGGPRRADWRRESANRDGDGPTGRIGAHVLPWQRSDGARRPPGVDSRGPRPSRTGGDTREPVPTLGPRPPEAWLHHARDGQSLLSAVGDDPVRGLLRLPVGGVGHGDNGFATDQRRVPDDHVRTAHRDVFDSAESNDLPFHDDSDSFLSGGGGG